MHSHLQLSTHIAGSLTQQDMNLLGKEKTLIAMAQMYFLMAVCRLRIDTFHIIYGSSNTAKYYFTLCNRRRTYQELTSVKYLLLPKPGGKENLHLLKTEAFYMKAAFKTQITFHHFDLWKDTLPGG